MGNPLKLLDLRNTLLQGSRRLSRFYPIIDRGYNPHDAPGLARALVQAGCTMIQVRAKGAASGDLFAFARQVICAAGETCRVIINDRFDIALGLGARGVHLGEYDLPVAAVRRCVPEGFIIGVTCRDPEAARRAEAEGADYLGAGAVFATGSKEDTRMIGLEGLAAVASSVNLPVYGIAGMTLENCARVVEAGAYGCAGITAVAAAGDPAQSYRRLEDALEKAQRLRKNKDKGTEARSY